MKQFTKADLKSEKQQTLTQREHDMLDIFRYEKWVVRDMDGCLLMFLHKPSRGATMWLTINNEVIALKRNAFESIKWEDEPYSTIDLLAWEIKD